MPDHKVTPKKYKAIKAKLYPQGEVDERFVDSLKKIPGALKAIGEPVREKGKMAMYGEAASDAIKQMMRHGR